MYYLVLNILLFLLGFVIIAPLKLSFKKKQFLLLIQLTIQLLYIHVFKEPHTLPDLPGYVNAFYEAKNLTINNVLQLQWYHKFEIGWCYLVYFLSRISDNHIVLFYVTSIVIVGSYSYLSWKYSALPIFSLFLFLFLGYGQSLFVLRQHTAMAICFLLIPFVLERKLKPFLMGVLVSFLIHKSALIFSIIYFIYPLKIDKMYIIMTLVGSVVLFVFFQLIISKLSVFITGFHGYINNDASVGANYINLLIQLCVLGLFYISSLKITELEGINKLLFQILLIAIMLSFSSIGFNAIIGRLNLYFTVPIFLTIPNFLSYYRGWFKLPIGIFTFLMFFILFIKNTDYIKNIVIFSL